MSSSDKPIIINNPAWGIGDAVVLSWLLLSANEGGGRPTRLIPRRNHEAFKLLGVEKYLLPDEDHPDMIVKWPSRGHVPEDNKPTRGWLRNWLDGYGCGADCKLVRPTPLHYPGDLAEAEKIWIARQRATGGGRRVLVFPDSIHNVRVWPEAGFSRLANIMESRGLATITMFQRYREHRFPFAYGGLSLRMMAALIQRADLVIGCESGPAHFSTCMQKPTAIMLGPTRVDITYEHDSANIVAFTGRGPCVGCNFQGDRGYQALCQANCDTIKTINPWDVAETLMSTEEKKVAAITSFAPVSRGQAVLLKPMSQSAPPPVQVTFGGGLNRGTSVDPSFMEKVAVIIKERCITRVVETGTYDGRGSTLALATALNREKSRLVTIECDKERAKMAARFHEESSNPHVEVWWGLSLPRASLPSREKMKDAIEESRQLGYPVEGRFTQDTINFYFNETNIPDAPEDLLVLALSTVEPELVFLDSAGYIGWEEWEVVRDRAKPGLLVGMDDVKHIKHWRSLKDAKERGWKVLMTDDRRYGAALLEAP